LIEEKERLMAIVETKENIEKIKAKKRVMKQHKECFV
jgi:hypothetical protein